MVAVARTALLGALLGLLCLWLLDATQQREVPPLVRVGRPAATRLIVLFVDSLSERDVREGAMPKLAARITEGGLHGPVQPCADAITVPCMTAAITGSDHLSVFALGTNFAAGSSAIESSVLGQLQRAGYRVGYLGERILKKTMTGLTYVVADLTSDEQIMEQLAPTLEPQGLDVLIMHFSGLDQAAHVHGEAAPEYSEARSVVDAQIEAVMAELRPSDHVLVMGDHGHTASGRHAAGLDVTSYAAYLGPQFARKLETPMLITEHAAIWARIFGFSRNSPGWLDDYYAGKKLRPRGAEGLPQSSPVPIWALVACVLLACATCIPSLGLLRARRSYGALVSFFASAALMAGLGAVWPDVRAFVWGSLTTVQLTRPASVVATALLGSGLLGWLRSFAGEAPNTWHARYARILAAAIVFALPTVHGLGGASVVQTWLALGLFGSALWFAKKRDARRAGELAFACLVVLSLLPVKHANYVLRGFTFYSRFLVSLSPYALPLVASGFLLAIFLAGRLVARAWPSWLAVAIGGSAAACAGVVSDQWFVVPCFLALPLLLLALRSPRFTPVAIACAIPAAWFFYGGALQTLAPILAAWSLCALLPRAFRDSDPALRGAVILSLVLICFRTAMGCRIAGIDFEFFFRFLPPEEDVTAHWIPTALFTVAKYLHTVMLGLLLARAHDPDLVAALREAVCIGRARLGMCLFFLAGLVVMQPAAGATIVGDVSQEGAIWVVALVVLALASLFGSRAEPRASTPCQASAEA
jgi:hypothetical protein